MRIEMLDTEAEIVEGCDNAVSLVSAFIDGIRLLK
jgi:hypothetical protein